MYLVLKRDWDALDGDSDDRNNHVVIPIGRHEVERIENPHGYTAPWLVLKGTKIGGTEGFWRQFEDCDDNDDCKVVIEE